MSSLFPFFAVAASTPTSLATTAAAQTVHHPPVSLGVTLFFASLLVLMIVALALEEKLHAKKSVIVGVFAVVTLLLADIFHLLPLNEAGKFFVRNPLNEQIEMPVYIPAIDWGIVAIILGSSVFVDIVSRSGLFTWIAIKLTKASGGDPLRLLALYGVMTVAFSALLNNVIAMLIAGSLTVVSLQKLKREEKLLGFLLMEGILTNIGGMLTLISSVPNIIVGNTAKISFGKFFIVASPYVTVATIGTIWIAAKLFDIQSLSDEKARREAKELVDSFDENDGIESKGFFWFGAIMTTLFILTLATTSFLPYIKDLGMGYVALGFALIMLIRFKSTADKFYQAVDWDLLAFFAALFVVIFVMEHAQVLTLIGKGIDPIIKLGAKTGAGLLLVTSAAASSVTDNIPLAAMLSKILATMKIPTESGLWWSVIFGANLGGNLTPIGSASTLVAVTIIHKQQINFPFGAFVVKALPFALFQIALATVYVILFLS